MMVNLRLCAPVPNQISEAEDGWSKKKKKRHYFFARQRRAQWAKVLKTVCLNPEGLQLHSNGSRGGVADRNQRVQGLASSGLPMTFCGSPGYQTVTFSLEWRLLPQVTSFICWGFSLQKSTKMLYVSLEEELALSQDCTLVSWCSTSLRSSLTWLAAIWTCTSELRESYWAWDYYLYTH